MTKQGEQPMWKVIVIDDEPMSVNRLTGLLNKTGEVEVVAGYSDPEEALMAKVAGSIDIAFVDVEMPAISGLVLAEKLQEQNPGLQVVMVTAHDHYALEAFQAHAVGYLLKPVTLSSITRQMNMMNQKRRGRMQSEESFALNIKTFGLFQCFTCNDEPDYFSWRTAKTKELLAFLNYHQGSPVTRDIILENLWPEMELDKAVKNFHATGYYLRETLKKRNLDHLLERKSGTYRLKWEEVKSDEKTFTDAVTIMMKGNPGVETLETILQIHENSYCGVDDYRWADDRRNNYDSLHLRAMATLAEKLDEMADDKKKLYVLKEMIKQDPYHEMAHEKIIEVYLKVRHVEAARQHLNDMEKLFKEELGTEVPEHIYQKFKGQTNIQRQNRS